MSWPRRRRKDVTIAPGDRAMLRRASMVIAIQTGLAAAVVVAIVIALVYSVSQQQRRDAIIHKLEDKAASQLAEDRDQPPATQLPATQPPAARPLTVDGLPSDCDEQTALSSTADLPLGVSEIVLCGVPVLLYAMEDQENRAAAGVSFADQAAETERLARISVIAGLIGTAGAAALGWLVGRRAVRPLGRALASQRRFVADTSHELRTPLAILHTRAQLLQRRPAADDDQRHEIDQLVDDTRVLTDIVHDLLLSAEMRHRPDQRQPVDLARVAMDIKNSFAAAADEAGVDIVVDADPAEQFVTTGVPSALRRAIAALVSNAMDHVDRGGTIAMGLARAATTVQVSVTDDGAGLDPKLAAELTQRFQRGPNASPNGHRLGLGLALVHEVVQAHDGAMVVDGKPGAGAVVTLTLPAAP